MSEQKSEVEGISRRSAVKRGGQWLTALVFAATVYPLLRFINFKLPKMPVRIRVDKDLKLGGFHIDKDFVLFLGEQGPWAVSRKCTHLGCSVSFNESLQKLVCPCHQSSFSIQGTRLAGPAKKNLKTYTVEKAPGDQKGYIVLV